MPELGEPQLDEGLDYREMWATLRDELAWCANQNVQAIHPSIVMGYMNFIYRIAEFDKKGRTDES